MNESEWHFGFFLSVQVHRVQSRGPLCIAGRSTVLVQRNQKGRGTMTENVFVSPLRVSVNGGKPVSKYSPAFDGTSGGALVLLQDMPV